MSRACGGLGWSPLPNDFEVAVELGRSQDVGLSDGTWVAVSQGLWILLMCIPLAFLRK